MGIQYTLFNTNTKPSLNLSSTLPTATTSILWPLPIHTIVSFLFGIEILNNPCNELITWIGEPVSNHQESSFKNSFDLKLKTYFKIKSHFFNIQALKPSQSFLKWHCFLQKKHLLPPAGLFFIFSWSDFTFLEVFLEVLGLYLLLLDFLFYLGFVTMFIATTALFPFFFNFNTQGGQFIHCPTFFLSLVESLQVIILIWEWVQ